MLFWPIMLYSNAQNIPNNAKKCIYNSQYIAHYAQVEWTIILTKTDYNIMRHKETQLHYHRV